MELKIIQFASATHDGFTYEFVVCEDGSLWYREFGSEEWIEDVQPYRSSPSKTHQEPE